MELIARSPEEAMMVLGLGLLAFLVSLVARWIYPQEGDCDYPEETAAELPDGWRLDLPHGPGQSGPAEAKARERRLHDGCD